MVLVIMANLDFDLGLIMQLKPSFSFALRNFDAEKVLSRPFFDIRKTYGAYGEMITSEMTDKEILKLIPSKTIDEKIKKSQIVNELAEKLKLYLVRIKKHVEKVEKLRDRYAVRAIDLKLLDGDKNQLTSLEEKYRRAHYIRERYLKIVEELRGLYHARVTYEMEKNEAGLGYFYRKRFASKLKTIRRKKKLSQADLGRLLGISQSGITSYESSQREPTLSMLNKMARVLDVSPLEFFT